MVAKKVALFGSTGSIGRSTVAVLSASQGRLEASILSAHRNLGLLVEQARQLKPPQVVATDSEAAQAFDWSELPSETELLIGPESLERVVASVDVVVAAIAGSAGLRSTWAAVAAGKDVAVMVAGK